ncbi:hypothetical protein ES319_A10G078700v1 [Gossypium barbadense]|uniref:Pectate lyase superfamily protein domain-containing protein n=1 Tax=Gossypium barbadense TaxID=3634 RepID=A0A5J5U0M2_GOSBA|nr:hypothetical protein ES319_A10G078700v1 [Gossypium barbadense]
MELIFTVFITISYVLTPGASGATSLFNVVDYGAVGDGKTDDSAAFSKAWKATCNAPSRNPILIIPATKIFLLKPVTFSGPCKPTSIHVLMSGNIVAPNSKMAWKGFHINRWLAFTHVNGLTIIGSGTINGRGAAWWSQPCLHKVPKGVTCKGPTALTFYSCNGLVLKGIRHINSQRNHITISNCKDVTFSNLHISAPKTSPNTDGIDISGDDCIAISSGSSHINITGIACGPGHGIREALEMHGGSHSRKSGSFELIALLLSTSIIAPTSGIRISDVSYRSIIGTSTTDKVINLSCDQNVGCTNIQFNYVYITSTVPGKKAYAFSFNAHGNYTHTRPVVKGLQAYPGEEGGYLKKDG